MKLLTIAFCEIRRMVRIRSVLLILMAMPLLLIFILGSALSSQFTMKDEQLNPMRVAIYNADHGELSAGLKAFLSSSTNSKFIIQIPVNSHEVIDQQIRAKKVDLGLVVPEDFSSAVMQGKAANWEIILGGDYNHNLVGSMLLQAFLDQTNRIQAEVMVLGPNLSQTGLIGQQVQYSDNVSHVELGKLSRSGEDYTAMQYYAAMMLVMFMLYSGMSAAISMLNEKEGHTLMRLMSLPLKPTQVVFGKMLGQILLSVMQAAIIIGATALLYGVNWGHSLLFLILLCLLTILISMCLAMIVALLVKSSKAVQPIFQTLIIFMTFLSGGMSPEVGPFLDSIAKFTVSHWASDGFLQLMLGSNTELIMQHVTILGCMGLGLLMISLLMYRRVGYHE
jgi:ABC-2 type transport system permease protein